MRRCGTHGLILPILAISGPAALLQISNVSPLKSGWLRVTLPGVCTLDIAPTMSANSILSDPTRTLQALSNAPKSPIKDYSTDVLKSELGKTLIKITQKDQGFYMRILVEAIPLPEAKEMSALRDPGLSQDDVHRFQELVKTTEFGPSEKEIGQHLLGPMKTERTRLNSYHAVRVTYTRQWESNPPVNVDTFFIFDRGRLIKIVASYRLSEAEKWAADIAHSLSTIRLVDG